MDEQRFRAAELALWAHYGARPAERWIELAQPAARVRVLEHGAGPPLLFVHGGPGAASIFAPVAARLTGFRCLLLDRPGCGLSGPIDYRGRQLDDTMADILHSTAQALGLDRVSFVASSFGGACALWFAQRHPGRVARMAFLGTPAFVPGMRIPAVLKLLATPGAGYLFARLPMNRLGVTQFLNTMGQQRAMSAARIPAGFYDWWMALANDTPTMRHERELIRHGLTWRGMRPEFVLDEAALGRMPGASHFYWGADEPFAPVSCGEALARTMRATLEVAPEAGHLPWFDDPAAAAASLGRFFGA